MLIKKRIVVGLTVVLLSHGPPAPARDAADDPIGALRDSIERANTSLEAIAHSLSALHIEQQAMLMIRRVELEERRMSPLNSAVRSAHQDVEQLEREIRQMERMREDFQQQVDEAVRKGADPLDLPERREVEQIENVIELDREQLVIAQARAIEAEDDLARRKKRMEILDEKLEELLEALSE